MEFVVERKGYYRENEEEEEDDDDEDEDGEEIGSSIISKFPFSSSSSSSSSKSKAYNNNNNDYNYKRRQIGDDIDEEEVVVGTRSCYINNMNYKKQGGGGGGGGILEGRESSRDQLGGDHDAHEREHMFDKVVTPSDVGKLNRLVIPKQHAEKYFPLHSSPASSSGPEKSGALLDFEDRNGKQWRFRYSYWNSSQSYVMTKGWSRFVKEKKLDAGDIVSFHRSLTTTTTTTTTPAADHEELGGGGGGGGRPKYRLFIDWRHRSPIQQHIPVIPPPPPPHGASWGYNHHHHQLTQMMNYNQFQPYFDHHRHSYNYGHGHQRSATLMGAPAAGSNIYYLTPSQPRLINIMGGSNHHDDDDDDDQTVINSVPVLLHPMNPPPPPHPPTPTPTPTSTSTSTSTNSSSASPKRLRLFGVNMEEHCFPIQTDNHHQQQHHVLPSVPYFTNISHLPKASSSYNVSSTTPPTLLPKSPNTTTTSSSLSFDLHLSDSH